LEYIQKKIYLMLLKVGSKGEDVKKLQTKLGLAADGHFGPGTEAKVKAWQAANGLTADGIVGNLSQSPRKHWIYL
jgi:peptidoglycan hydrolase-like protein with peptidoglycan-binding domain